jgi:hypothetical protein
MFFISNNKNQLLATPVSGLDKQGEIGSMSHIAFVPSTNVLAYPCARRRSIAVGNDITSFPFDPEARMSTEKNTRNIVSKNGTHNSFLQQFKHTINGNNTMMEAELAFTLNGYSFCIKIPSEFWADTHDISGNTIANAAKEDPLTFLCNDLASALGATDTATSLYANILTETVPFVEGEFDALDATSVILRNQDSTETAQTLDAPVRKDSLSPNDPNPYGKHPSHFYFSGLSFSAIPAAKTDLAENAEEARHAYETIAAYSERANKTIQEYTSLRLFIKQGDKWLINQEALLPEFRHGDIENSVDVGHLRAESLTRDGIFVPSLEVKKTTDNYYRLVFTGATHS